MLHRILITVYIFLPLSASLRHNIQSKLISNMLENHPPKYALPISNTTPSIGVNVSWRLDQFVELNEQDKTITLITKLKLSWFDEYSAYDALDYDGIEGVAMEPGLIWHPTMYIRSRASDFGTRERLIKRIYVWRNGQTNKNVAEKTIASCNFQFTDFPYDSHECNISYQLLGHKYPLLYFDDVFVQNSTAFNPNPEFEIESIKVFKKQTVFKINIKLRRRPEYTIYTILTPLTIISAFSIIAFLLPPQSEAKMDIQINVMLTYALYMVILSDKLPATEEQPNIMKLTTGLLTTNLCSFFITVLTLRIADIKHMPINTKVFQVCSIIGHALLLPNLNASCSFLKMKNGSDLKANKVSNIEPEMTDESNDNSSVQEIVKWLKTTTQESDLKTKWHYIASLLDRLALISVSFASYYFGSTYL